MKKVNRYDVEFLVVDDTENSTFWDHSAWEEENYKKIKEKSFDHTYFVNAGGWIGPFTLFASKLFKRVYSLEPDIIAFNELKRNVEINNYENVKIYNKAFYDKVTKINIGSNYSDLGRSGTSIFQEKNSIKVDTITLNKFFETELINEKTLLMLDVEGAEYLLFNDFSFFEKYKPTILLSLHLTFLTDTNYNILLSSLEKLLTIYNFDLDLITTNRKTLQYNSNFIEINVLMEPKK
jgi:FkbM family methyltransferase